MAKNDGGQVILAAAVLGLCVLGAAFMLGRSLDRATEKLAAVQTAAVQAGAARVAKAEPRPPRRGPDPSRVYKVETAGSPSKGPESAKVTLVEFSDFQCPFCARVSPTMQQIEKEYGDQVRIVFKHLPLSIHPKAPAAHAAAAAAHEQGKFWEMHDRIFANQREMSAGKYEEYARELGLDVDQYKKDLASSDLKKAIAKDQSEASALGVTGTPAFFINGRYLSGAKPFSEFKRLIDQALSS